MSKSLNSRRNLSVQRGWSPNVSSFLKTPGRYSDIANIINSTNENSSKSKLMQERDSYTTSKRALEIGLRRRSDAYSRYTKKLEKIEHPQRYVPKTYQQKCAEPSKVKDNHIIESIIEERKQINFQSSDSAQQTHTLNLKTRHKLPRDKGFFVKTKNRVFYWG